MRLYESGVKSFPNYNGVAMGSLYKNSAIVSNNAYRAQDQYPGTHMTLRF